MLRGNARARRLAAGAVAIAAWVLAAIVTAAAAAATTDADTVKLDVQPTDVVVDLGLSSRAPLVVVLRNPSRIALAHAKLDFIAPVGLTAKAVRTPLPRSTGDLEWRVDVTASGRAPSPAKLVVLARYATAKSTAVAAATVSVTLQPPLAAASVLKAAILPPEGNVDELNPLGIVLQIENPSRRTVDVDHVELLAPAYVKLAPNAAHAKIGAGRSANVPLQLTTGVAVPGTYALVVRFNARFDDGAAVSEPVVAQSKVTVGIPGVGDAMQYLGIPSLLLLPGILVILTFTAAFTALTRRAPIDVKQPALLVLAVVLSFVAALIYPVVTPYRFGSPRDYLHGYDLRDVLYLWIGSIVVAAIAAVVLAGIVLLRIRRLQPRPADRPIDVLRKLHRHHVRRFALVQVRHREPPPGAVMLVLPFGPVDTGQRWLVPRAQFAPVGETPGATARATTIQNALEAVERGETGAEQKLLRAVNDGVAENQIALSWADGASQGPRTVDDADYVSAGAAKRTFLGPGE